MRNAVRVCASVLALASFAALAWAQANEMKLFDFENAADAGAWRAANAEKSASDEHATSGKHSLKVKLTLVAGGPRSGIATEALAQKDWSACKTLKFDVFAEDGLSLTIAVRDRNARATRKNFRKDLEIRKGANTVDLPVSDIGAEIDLKTVQAINLIATYGEGERTIYLDNMRLEK